MSLHTLNRKYVRGIKKFKNDTYAIIAIEMEAKVMDMCNHAKKVRSFAKKTLGSIFTGTFLGFACGWSSIEL